MDIAHIKYTWEHKKAFLKVEKRMTGQISWRGIFHDCDKLLMYMFRDAKTVHKWHRSHSRHHTVKACTREDYIQMLVDWECAKFTKPDKPLDAWETMYKYYPQLEEALKPLMLEFSLDKNRRSKDDTIENPEVWDNYFYYRDVA